MNREAFVKEVQEICNISSFDQAEDGVLVVFSLLSHRLTPNEAKDVQSQLPDDLKSLWKSNTFLTSLLYLKENPQEQQLKYRKKEELLAYVKNEIEKRNIDVGAEKLTEAVFHVLKKQVTPGEIDDVAAQLPKDISKMLTTA